MITNEDIGKALGWTLEQFNSFSLFYWVKKDGETVLCDNFEPINDIGTAIECAEEFFNLGYNIRKHMKWIDHAQQKTIYEINGSRDWHEDWIAAEGSTLPLAICNAIIKASKDV